MKNTKIINVYEITSSLITSRSVVDFIFDEKVKEESVILNFSDVRLINRSSSHQLIVKLIENPEVKIEELNDDIYNMLKAVENSLSDVNILENRILELA